MTRPVPLGLALALVACARTTDVAGDDGDDSDDSDLVVVDPPTVTCAAPSAEAPTPYASTPFDGAPPPSLFLEGGTATIADLDEDGLLDVLPVHWDRVDLVRQTSPGVFAPPTPLVLAEGAARHLGFAGAVAGDLDDDGDLDLLVTGRGVPAVLLRNDDGAFVDVTAGSGFDLLPEDHHAGSPSLSDLDGDGDLDVFVPGHGVIFGERFIFETSYPNPSLLLRNDGGLRFTDITRGRFAAALQLGFTFQGGFLDADHDGDQDLYLLNDLGEHFEPGVLARNDDGVFVPAEGPDAMRTAMSGMGLALGDIDGNGVEDLAVVGIQDQVLYLGQPDGTYYDVTRSWGYAGVGDQVFGWGTDFLDLDNDGDLDMVQPYGFLDIEVPYDPLLQTNAVFVQDPAGVLVDRAADLGLASRGAGRSLVPADLDRDGWLDLVEVDAGADVTVRRAACGEAAWLVVELRQPAPNVRAVGATVVVRAGDRAWTRTLRAGGTGFRSSLPPELHFGLGDVDTVDEVEVRWPDGEVDVVRRDLATRRRIRVERPGTP